MLFRRSAITAAARFTGFSQDAERVVAQFSDGDSIAADLLVGADGIRSTVRQQCLPEVAAAICRLQRMARAAVGGATSRPAVHDELFELHVVRPAAGRAVPRLSGGGPDNDLRPGHRRYNVIWYRPADEATKLQWLLTDESGITHAISIPPPLIRREAIAEMRAAAERLLAPQFRQIVRLIAEPILQPIYDLESPRMAFGRVAILGDAAFVARPHVGAGVAKAADDAAALGRMPATRRPMSRPACKRFEAARLGDNHRIIERARHLGAYLQATRTEEEQERAGRHETDSAVIKETATLDFLYA